MNATFFLPIDYCTGKMTVQSNFYFRRNRFGKVFAQRCPRRLSEKQQEWNKEFAKRYAGQNPNAQRTGIN